MVEANPKSYKERMREARAAAGAQRKAEEAEQRRRRELVHEALWLAKQAVIVELRHKGLKVSQFKAREITAEAKARMPRFVTGLAKVFGKFEETEHSRSTNDAISGAQGQ
jgi:hypothetical protein